MNHCSGVNKNTVLDKIQQQNSQPMNEYELRDLMRSPTPVGWKIRKSQSRRVIGFVK